MTRTVAFMAAAVVSAASFAAFRDAERDRIMAYWSAPERYLVAPAESKNGPWQVRLTPEGSLWLWALNQKRGLGKIFSTPVPRNDEERKWEDWIEAKVAYDKWMATVSANAGNSAKGFAPVDAGPEPSLPGDIPESLWRLVGEAPSFMLAVQPQQHSVSFHDGYKVTFVDNTNVPNRYAYYRFSEGVRHGGQAVKKMSQSELDGLFTEAGVPLENQRVMKAVSLLEGGFDSVNTYDTGFVSVGFIQFACLSKGSGSLGSVLLRHKTKFAKEFESDFRHFGIDVKEDGTLLALGLADGQTYEGAEAAKQIIKDKRLIAVFQRAGLQSKAFKISQIQIANEQYYPASETLSLKLGGQTIECKAGDVVRSEAGLATLMDRKVNTGKVAPLQAKAQEIANTYGLKSLNDFAAYERELVASLRFRKSYLDDETLSQPIARERGKPLTSRKATRKGRG